MQGYGATECGPASATSKTDHGLGTVGRTIPPVEVKLAEDGQILVKGPTVFAGYWRDEAATAAAFTADGWYQTGDIGRHDDAGHLILMGRIKDIIVLPNGFNVYPEDIENALRTAGIRDSVVIETQPGRIEAVVLAPGEAVMPRGGDVPGQGVAALHRDPTELRAEIDAAVKRANATLGMSQRVAAWRLWPDADFPRTHTLKVKRDRIRAWAVVEQPLPIDDTPTDPGPASLADDRDLDTQRRRARVATAAAPGSGASDGRPAVEDERRADLAHDEAGIVGELDPTRSGREVVGHLGPRGVGAAGVGEVVDHDEPLVRRRRAGPP